MRSAVRYIEPPRGDSMYRLLLSPYKHRSSPQFVLNPAAVAINGTGRQIVVCKIVTTKPVHFRIAQSKNNLSLKSVNNIFGLSRTTRANSSSTEKLWDNMKFKRKLELAAEMIITGGGPPAKPMPEDPELDSLGNLDVEIRDSIDSHQEAIYVVVDNTLMLVDDGMETGTVVVGNEEGEVEAIKEQDKTPQFPQKRSFHHQLICDIIFYSVRQFAMAKIINFCILAAAFFGFSHSKIVTVDTGVNEITMVENEKYLLVFHANGTVPAIAPILSYHGIVSITPNSLNLSAPPPWNVTLKAQQRGHDTVYMQNITGIDVADAFIVVTVERSRDLELVSAIVGWLYFVSWSISFYPQIYENWRRKSVVGLNFDFLALNVIGFFLYSLFNCGLYWNTEIEDEYFDDHPRGLNPVLLNDVVFSLHALTITIVTISQCFFYERGGQRVSKIATGIIVIIFLIFFVSLVLPFLDFFNWLQFLYICSYIKLSITLMKYVPQAFMNYKRKSTIGWSIGNVIMDFTGGMLSMMQMIINADNYDDWASLFGDPTKFGLGLFSVCFDIVFLVQHYVLYRNSGYEELPGAVVAEPQTASDVNDDDSEGDPSPQMPDLIQTDT